MLGEDIIKGMAVTAKNFAGSFVSKDRLTTVQYPEERQVLSEAVRSFPFLVYDGDDWEQGLRCVSCQICEKECPPKCIYIVKSKDKKPDYLGKPQLYPAVFDIDLSVCMSCGICAEVCPFESIMMDQDFELSTSDRFGGLLVHKEQLARSHEHHLRIRPSEAGPIERRRAEAVAKAQVAAEAKAKTEAEKAKAASASSSSAA
jgi:NADH-quinone oxidoreductase subunit I